MNAASVVSDEASTGTNMRLAPPMAAPAAWRRLEQRHCVFADDDRVVDDDAERHDESDQRDDADAEAENPMEQRQTKQTTHWNANRHPPADAGIQEQEQRHHHQQQPGPGVFANHLQLCAEHVPDVVRHRSSTPGGNVGACRSATSARSFAAIGIEVRLRINVIWIAGRPSRVTIGWPSRGRRTTSAMSPRRTGGRRDRCAAARTQPRRASDRGCAVAAIPDRGRRSCRNVLRHLGYASAS